MPPDVETQLENNEMLQTAHGYVYVRVRTIILCPKGFVHALRLRLLQITRNEL